METGRSEIQDNMASWNEIADSPAYAGQRVFVIEREGTRFWIKRGAKDYRNALQRLLPPWGSPLETEIHSLQSLSAHGVLVPELIHRGSNFIVLSDIGENLHDSLRQSDLATQRMLLTSLAQELSLLHGSGRWHGNALLRNFTWMDQRIGLLDLENTEHPNWPLGLKHAYDIWQVLFSLGKMRNGAALIRHFLAAYQPATPARRSVRVTACMLAPLYAPFALCKPVLPHAAAPVMVALSAFIFIAPRQTKNIRQSRYTDA